MHACMSPLRLPLSGRPLSDLGRFWDWPAASGACSKVGQRVRRDHVPAAGVELGIRGLVGYLTKA